MSDNPHDAKLVCQIMPMMLGLFLDIALDAKFNYHIMITMLSLYDRNVYDAKLVCQIMPVLLRLCVRKVQMMLSCCIRQCQ